MFSICLNWLNIFSSNSKLKKHRDFGFGATFVATSSTNGFSIIDGFFKGKFFIKRSTERMNSTNSAFFHQDFKIFLIKLLQYEPFMYSKVRSKVLRPS